jgi:hypothetical protein
MVPAVYPGPYRYPVLMRECAASAPTVLNHMIKLSAYAGSLPWTLQFTQSELQRYITRLEFTVYSSQPLPTTGVPATRATQRTRRKQRKVRKPSRWGGPRRQPRWRRVGAPDSMLNAQWMDVVARTSLLVARPRPSCKWYTVVWPCRMLAYVCVNVGVLPCCHACFNRAPQSSSCNIVCAVAVCCLLTLPLFHDHCPQPPCWTL